MKKLDFLSCIKTLFSVRLFFALPSCIFLNIPAFAQGDALKEATSLSTLASYSMLMDVERVGNKLVAVGERGHILMSSDEARTWTQVVDVPVRVTLTASYFVDDKWGWVVGHDGVVLRTFDGGEHWVKLLDGYQANELVLAHVLALISQTEQAMTKVKTKVKVKAALDELAALKKTLDGLIYFSEDAESFKIEGASRPFLDVWFKDANEGIVVGAYGLILRTSNGGDSWAPSYQSLDNPEAFHLNKIEQVGELLFLAGEAGVLYRSRDWGKSWTLLDSPYGGSFFGVVAAQNNAVIAYGLRGNAFISHDSGDNWTKIETGVDASLFGCTLLSDGTNVLVGAGGIILYIDGQGQLINKTQSKHKLPLSSVLPGLNQGLLTVGLDGIQQIPAFISTTASLLTGHGLAHE